MDEVGAVIEALPTPPIIMGHSFGGTFRRRRSRIQRLRDHDVLRREAAGAAIHGTVDLIFGQVAHHPLVDLNGVSEEQPA
jgi:hypothetical protein